jgi:hypothetical protein
MTIISEEAFRDFEVHCSFNDVPDLPGSPGGHEEVLRVIKRINRLHRLSSQIIPNAANEIFFPRNFDMMLDHRSVNIFGLFPEGRSHSPSTRLLVHENHFFKVETSFTMGCRLLKGLPRSAEGAQACPGE